MNVWVVEAEHPMTPGRIVKVCASRDKAVRMAIEFTDLMPQRGKKKKAAPDNWESIVEKVQDEHGAQYCYVEITPHEVLPA